MGNANGSQVKEKVTEKVTEEKIVEKVTEEKVAEKDNDKIDTNEPVKIDSVQLKALEKIKKKRITPTLTDTDIKMVNVIKKMDVCCYFSYTKTLNKLTEDTHYRNLFEVGTTGGSNNVSYRIQKDTKLFGYSSGMDKHLRPKYGNLHFEGNKFTNRAITYGELYLVLKKSLHKYCTVTYGNSRTDSSVYYFEDPYLFIKSLGKEKYEDLANKGVLKGLSNYIEIQIHCSLELDKSFEVIRAPEKYKTGKPHKNLTKFSKKFNIPIEYY